MPAASPSSLYQKMKKYPEIVKSILEDARESGQERISLVDVIWQYDERNKLAPLLEEINDALKTIGWITTSRQGKELFFDFVSRSNSAVEITEADFRWADKEYRRRLCKSLASRCARR